MIAGGWSRFSLAHAAEWAASRAWWRASCETVVMLMCGGSPRAAITRAWISVQRN